MAYLSKNLSVLAYANGFTLWHYTTPDRLSDVLAPGYFDGSASDMLRIADRIIINANDQTHPSGDLEFGEAAVCMNAGGSVGLHALKLAE